MLVNYDVAIVGGGLAGLTAAIYAANAGKKTIILEQQKQLGGRAITKKKDGAYFDLGGHALYKGVGVEILNELNVKIEGNTPSSDAFGMWNGQLLSVPTGIMSLFTSPLLPVKGKWEVGNILGKLGKLDTDQYRHISVRDWIESNFRDPMARHLFYSLLRTASYGLAPDLQAAGPVLKQLQNALNGVYYLDKGWGSLVEEMRKKAVEKGATCHAGIKVTEVEHENGKAKAIVCSDGTRIAAENIILTTSPEVSYKMVPKANRTSLQVWKDQAISITSACLTVVLRRLPNPKFQFIYGIDQPVFLSNQSRAANLSDQGDQVIQLIKYQGSQTDAQKDREDLEQVLDLAQPGWREELVSKQYLPKIVVTHDFMHLNGRVNPGPEVPEIRGLYVAGDWTTHGELLADAAIASGKRAIEHILTHSHQERNLNNGYRDII
ncbi:phytoene desaturase family protein [Shimazuella kribbensis]|uniref:phytoene desaturase family protein n=1 Tax=Shimazuella kribbensis TaxID=139808 RepID=UPI0004007BF6|nr:NAD(P)/FAD-dependent oxidoreductase [Shimazuella kribbensis]